MGLKTVIEDKIIFLFLPKKVNGIWYWLKYVNKTTVKTPICVDGRRVIDKRVSYEVM